MGEKAYTSYTNASPRMNIDPENQPNGIYLVRVQTYQGNTTIKKVELMK